MTTPHWTDALVRLNACADAVAWARSYPTLAEAWAACDRGDWMLWLAGQDAGEPWSDARKPLVLAACACARLAMPYTTDSRVPTCIETTELWCGDEATMVGVQQVRAATAAAASAASAASASSSSAAYSASYAASASASTAARRHILSQCADIARKMLPCPVLK